MCYDPQNARVLGKFEDVDDRVVFKLCIVLMAKLYCYVFNGVGRGTGNGSLDSDDDSGLPTVKRGKGTDCAIAEIKLTVWDYVKSRTQKKGQVY